MDWYDQLRQGAAVSLSKLFDPNYLAVRAATMQSPYSDSRGMSLQEMFQATRPSLHQAHQIPPLMGDDGWQINRLPRTHPALKAQKLPYQGML